MLVFVKLGGSLITDKTRPATPRPEVIRRLARELRQALEARPDLHLVLGHGSGSFGHVLGREYNLRVGIRNSRGWEGYARTAAIAARLNHIVADICLQEGLLVVSLFPSASAWCHDGELIHLDMRPLRVLLEKGLVPLVRGDVALDEVRGGTIVSTEEVFAYLARRGLGVTPPRYPDRILLVGEVAGVYTRDPHRDPMGRVIPHIDARDLGELAGLGESHGTDVTGGMAAKVREMAQLARDVPGLTVHILSGREPGLLARALIDPHIPAGTRLTAGDT